MTSKFRSSATRCATSATTCEEHPPVETVALTMATERFLAKHLFLFNTLSVGRESAAHSLYRLTHERPARATNPALPTQRWCSDCGKADTIVTGYCVRADRLHPSRALGLHSTEAACRWSGQTSPGHPAAALGSPFAGLGARA